MSRDLDVEFIVDDGRGERIVGTLALPNEASALVLFAHGGGSSRLSPRNQFVAEVLRRGGFGTLLLDLLTPDEQRSEEATARVRFDVALLAARIVAATDWLTQQRVLPAAPIGYFGASTGAAAALVAAAERPATVGAVVVARRPSRSRVGRCLADVRAPTLLIVGADDLQVLAVNEAALARARRPPQGLVDRPGGVPPVRGAGRSRRGGRDRARMVRAVPDDSTGGAARGDAARLIRVPG